MTGRILALAVFSASLLACGGKRTHTAPGAPGPAQESAVLVINDHWLDVAIYAVRMNSRFRLGTVRGFTEQELEIPRSIIGSTQTIRLLAAPIGSNRSHLTDPIAVFPDHIIDFRVTSPLNFSTFNLRVM